MMAHAELRAWINGLEQVQLPRRCIVLTGGGRFADAVRELDSCWQLPAQRAHQLAIEAMRLNSQFLRTQLPVVPFAPSLEAIVSAAVPTVLADPLIATRELSLPASWEVTSDSIAMALAAALGADAVLLVKAASARQLLTAVESGEFYGEVVDSHIQSLCAHSAVAPRVLSKQSSQVFFDALRDGIDCGFPFPA